MTTMSPRAAGTTSRKPVIPTVRCAIYTRKSSEEGLEKEFNSLDAQRECGEAYIASMKHEGWVCLPEKYDDGGYTGGNTERPAVQRLLKDIEAGRIDTVVVYKVDRLSRSLMDFARMMELFEKRHVSFVSVTQQFNTTHSMGRLTLNILLSFAQFEREIISERTRDKIAAARRKGKWSGGRPILGYQVIERKLVIMPEEAKRVRHVFETYLRTRSLLKTAAELDALGWRTKQWIMRSGESAGGATWDKRSVWNVLTNVAYIGKVRYKEEVHKGEHQGIIEEDLFQRAQSARHVSGLNGGSEVQTKHAVLLKGLLQCGACKCAMGHVYSMKNGRVAYRYYKCQNSQKRGRSACPHGSVPAEQIDAFVLDQIRKLLKDPEVFSRTFAAIRESQNAKLNELTGLEAALRREVAELAEDARTAAVEASGATGANPGQHAGNGRAGVRLAGLTTLIREAEQRLSETASEAERIRSEIPTRAEVEGALNEFGTIWDNLTPVEQARTVHLLVASITFVGTKVTIEFRTSGLRSLKDIQKGQQKS